MFTTGAYTLWLESKRRTKDDTKETQPADGQADRSCESVPGFLHEWHKHSSHRVGDDRVGDEPESNNTAPHNISTDDQIETEKMHTHTMKNQANRDWTILQRHVSCLARKQTRDNMPSMPCSLQYR